MEETMRGSNLLGGVREKVAHGAEALSRKSLRELAGDTKQYVKNNPGKVVLASFLAGLVLGAIVRGRGNGRG